MCRAMLSYIFREIYTYRGCMCLYIYVYSCLWIQLYTYTSHPHVHIQQALYTDACPQKHIYISLNTHNFRSAHIHTFIMQEQITFCTFIYKWISLSIHIHLSQHVSVDRDCCIWTCGSDVYIYIYIYIYLYIHRDRERERQRASQPAIQPAREGGKEGWLERE